MLHTETGAEGAKNEGKKMCEKKAVVWPKWNNFCNMQSWELSCFCPHLKNRALKRWRWLIDLIMKYRYGSQVENRDAAYLTAMDFLTCCTMRRKSLRLLSPNLCLNSDGDTGAFFRVKNYRREFFARKPSAWPWRYCPSELTSWRDFASEAGFSRFVYFL